MTETTESNGREPVADANGGGNRNNTVDALAGELPRRPDGQFDIMWLAYGGDEGLPPHLKRKRIYGRVSSMSTDPVDDVTLGAARASLVALRRLRINERFDSDRNKAIANLETYLQATDGVVDAEGTIYESRALNEADWQLSRQGLIGDGWQFLKRDAGVIYIRKRYLQP